ncbi:MAG: rod shape-determining protein RodA [Clostridia bacterium]|nr:rod shape-determining protein RodA [Clostridia bacterium]
MFKTLLKNTDYIVLICVLLLVIIGILGIFSAGYNTDVNKDEYIKQLIWFGISVVIMLIIWMLDYNMFDIGGYILYGISLVLLVAVLFTPSLMGARSWFNFGGFLYQPSELMKIGVILCTAKAFSIYKNNIGQIDKRKKIIVIAIISLLFLIPVVLILLQPDFGTAVAFFVICAFMLFRSGIKYRYIIAAILLILIMVPVVYFFILNPTQQQRIKVFLNPELDPLDSGYNAIQSKIAVGSGMVFGTGLLKGAQTQYGYLPIKSSDFIFSVISEEMGFVISALVVIIYTVLLIRMILIARNAKDDFSSFIVTGIVGMFFFHFVQNIGMTIGLLPITGVPLPFLSYGGSSMITNMVAIAIVLNISARKSQNMFLD